MEDRQPSFQHERLGAKQASIDFSILDATVIWGGRGSTAAFAALGGFSKEGLVKAGRIVGREVGGDKEVGGIEGEGEECCVLTVSSLPKGHV